MMIRTLLALAALALAFPSHSQQPIRVGAFLAVTGGAAFLGDPEQKTLELYVEKVNANIHARGDHHTQGHEDQVCHQQNQ